MREAPTQRGDHHPRLFACGIRAALRTATFVLREINQLAPEPGTGALPLASLRQPPLTESTFHSVSIIAAAEGLSRANAVRNGTHALGDVAEDSRRH